MASHDDSCRVVGSCRNSSCSRAVVIPGAFSDVEHAKPPYLCRAQADAMFLLANRRQECFRELLGRPNVWSGTSERRSPSKLSVTHGDINSVEFMPSDTNCFATCGQDQTSRLYAPTTKSLNMGVARRSRRKRTA
jgi:hypothetical protein